MSSTSLPPSDSDQAQPASAAPEQALPLTEPLSEAASASPDLAESDAQADSVTAETPEAQAEAGEGASDAAPAIKALSPAECALALKQRFPALFGGAAKPLKLRIQADIQERAPGVFSKQTLSAFFRRHTGSTSYLMAVSRAKERFDLDGQPAGELSEEHRQIAVTELARRKALQNERRQAELQARGERAALLAEFEQLALTPADFAVHKALPVAQIDASLVLARQEAAEPAPVRDERGPRGPRGQGGAREGQGQGRPGQGPRRDRDDRPRGARPAGDRPAGDRPAGDRPPRAEAPQAADRPQGDRVASDRPRSDRPRSDRPRTDRPQGDRPRGDRPDQAGRGPRRDGDRRPDARFDGASRPEGGSRPANPNAPKSALALALEAAKAKSSKG